MGLPTVLTANQERIAVGMELIGLMGSMKRENMSQICTSLAISADFHCPVILSPVRESCLTLVCA